MNVEQLKFNWADPEANVIGGELSLSLSEDDIAKINKIGAEKFNKQLIAKIKKAIK